MQRGSTKKFSEVGDGGVDLLNHRVLKGFGGNRLFTNEFHGSKIYGLKCELFEPFYYIYSK
jgi:hypothetical protein